MKKILSLSALLLCLTACSSGDAFNILPDNRPNYKTSSTINPLEVPPDLTQSSIDDNLAVSELSATDNASLQAYRNERRADSTQANNLQASLESIQRSGDASWIEITETPDKVFDNVKSFWLNNGLALKRVDKNIGIIETDWLEKQANMPKNGISALIARALSGLRDDGGRDKFRTRVDFDGQKSYVYITHYGVTEKRIDDSGRLITGNNTKKDDAGNYTWVPDARNPELEVEMLRRLNLFLHKNGKQVASKPSTQAKQGGLKFSQLSDGTPALVIAENYNNAWLLVGIAIDRAGFNLAAQNRRSGIYRFEKITEKKSGFIIRKVERDISAYEIGISDQGNQQVAVVRSIDGKVPSAEQASAVLQKISQEIKF